MVDTMLVMMMALAASATSPAMTAAYDRLCTVGDGTPPAILALADRSGWRNGGAGVPADFDPAFDRFAIGGGAILKLVTRESTVRDERFDTCGISVAAAEPALVTDVEAMLGFAPAVHLGSSATFFAVRADGRWEDASTLSRPDLAADKAAGRFYSVMVTSTDTAASVFSLRIRPATAR